MDFKFKHPNPNDFKRTAEKVSGLQLDWYMNYWTETTEFIDYAVESINKNNIELMRKGGMPMPLDLTVTYTDGSIENFYIPLREMMGSKPTKSSVLESWAWVQPVYQMRTKKAVKSVQIDPDLGMADTDKTNNYKEVN
jgi:hypothetical protein